MQIWRMRTDGTEAAAADVRRQQQLVPAPLARREVGGVPLVREGREGPPGEPGRDAPHDAGRAAAPIQVLAKLFGGQGTINVPSWSPDSTSLAFVSYRLAQP